MRSVLLTVVVLVAVVARVTVVAEVLDVVFGFLYQDVQPLA